MTVSSSEVPAATATTKRVLFGHLQTEDAASAVARRLRTAIGLGVLTDGEKLPREADLARQLGVTTFSLREALGTLRGEGLIVTRVGKNGGSYVEHPPAGESMAGEELVRLSSTDLRDLGDWRAALTTYAAHLAARRAAHDASARLAASAEEMRAAGTSAAGRRALGRFHVELAACAHSMRLTRAELTLHEEFDWLVQVLLGDDHYRGAVADRMREVAEEVAAGRSAAAWEAGERMVTFLVTEMMRARLRMIATDDAQGGRGQDGGDVVAGLRVIFDRTLRTLADIAAELAVVLEQRPNAAGLYADVARGVMPRLGELDDVVHGLGFMAEPGAVADVDYWVAWWQRAADGAFDRDYSHQLDPTRDDFYDYVSKDFMKRPRESGQPSAMGPFIDHGGVGDDIVTVAVPVHAAGAFVGIVAADLRVASLERALSGWLAQADGVCVLLNDESRVLLSNSVAHVAGDLLPDDGELSLTDLGLFGWVIGRERA